MIIFQLVGVFRSKDAQVVMLKKKGEELKYCLVAEATDGDWRFVDTEVTPSEEPVFVEQDSVSFYEEEPEVPQGLYGLLHENFSVSGDEPEKNAWKKKFFWLPVGLSGFLILLLLALVLLPNSEVANLRKSKVDLTAEVEDLKAKVAFLETNQNKGFIEPTLYNPKKDSNFPNEIRLFLHSKAKNAGEWKTFLAKDNLSNSLGKNRKYLFELPIKNLALAIAEGYPYLVRLPSSGEDQYYTLKKSIKTQE